MCPEQSRGIQESCPGRGCTTDPFPLPQDPWMLQGRGISLSMSSCPRLSEWLLLPAPSTLMGATNPGIVTKLAHLFGPRVPSVQRERKAGLLLLLAQMCCLTIAPWGWKAVKTFSWCTWKNNPLGTCRQGPVITMFSNFCIWRFDQMQGSNAGVLLNLEGLVRVNF